MKFPTQKYIAVKKELAAARRVVNAEKAAWKVIHNKVPEKDRDQLDYEFKIAFDSLTKYGNVIEDTYETLKALSDKGASGHMMDDYELAMYNIAQLIDDMETIEKDEKRSVWAMKIIRLTIAADANLETQRAYVGNGGVSSIEMLLGYTSHEVSPTRYTIMTWVLKNNSSVMLFQQFLVTLGRATQPSPHDEWLERTCLLLIAAGYSPFDSGEGYHYLDVNLFKRLFRWLYIIFPYEEEEIKHYITSIKTNISEDHIKNFMGAISSSPENRKFFKEYFSHGKHWLLEHIITHLPAFIFALIKRNELEILSTFLKRHKQEMRALRDDNGNSLLQYATAGKRVSQKMIRLLADANC